MIRLDPGKATACHMISLLLQSCSRAFFFFSSRRRHTRLQGDWSSDVCSSDLGPAKIWVDPTMTPVNGRHQALAWNMGTMWRMVSSSEIPNESVSASPRQCRNIARWVYTTPFGLPVVPEV